MEALDFSGLHKIAYKGFEDEAERDSLLEAGYTIVESSENPFTAPQASGAILPLPNERTAPKRKFEPFTDMSGERDYKKMYRAAHDFHERHNPPTVDREYWRTHTPGLDDTPQAEIDYWLEIAQDAGKTSAAGNNDPFLTALITAVIDELDREYKTGRDSAGAPNNVIAIAIK